MKCKNCGAEMHLETSVIYTSYPPQYRWVCPKCSNVHYQECGQALNEMLGIKQSDGIQGVDVPVDPWFDFRRLAAKDILCAMITKEGYDILPADDVHVPTAIKYADELIEQLKKER